MCGTGTRDRSAFVAMGDAMDFRDNLGEEALMAYINNLSKDGAVGPPKLTVAFSQSSYILMAYRVVGARR